MATVNGLEVVIYDFMNDSNGNIICDCFIPDAGWRLPIAAALIQVSDNKSLV